MKPGWAASFALAALGATAMLLWAARKAHPAARTAS